MGSDIDNFDNLPDYHLSRYKSSLRLLKVINV